MHACIKDSAKSSNLKSVLKFDSESQPNVHDYRSTGTPEKGSMTGALPLTLQKGSNGDSGAFLITIS